VAEIAEAGVGRKAVVAAERTLANALCADAAKWHSDSYAADIAYEIHSVRSDVRRPMREMWWVVLAALSTQLELSRFRSRDLSGRSDGRRRRVRRATS
jgi:hypothetical protein